MKLGAIKRPKDKRDIILGSAVAPIAIPNSYKTDVSSVNKLLQKYPTCGAVAGSYLLAILTGKNFSERFLWEEIKKIDNFPLSVGTDMGSILKTLKNIGNVSYDKYPDDYVVQNTIEKYSYFVPTSDDYSSTEKISGYGFGVVDINRIKQDIYQNKAIIILHNVDSNFFHNSTPQTQKGIYGHFDVAYGYDDRGYWLLDGTDEYKEKFMTWDNIKWIRETGTIVTLTEEQKKQIENARNSLTYIVQNYASKLSLNILQTIIDSYNKYIKQLGG